MIPKFDFINSKTPKFSTGKGNKIYILVKVINFYWSNLNKASK